ncbi:MAG TPA: hypothetical protein VI583_08480 [Cyclobacteriaceae bacterium]|nr:hypothetical protein [Cyclobacteriaceae bacterium]
MLRFLKILTIAAVGIAIGTVASKLVKTEKIRVLKKTTPAQDQNNQLRADNEKRSRDNDSDEDLENCFI